MTSKSKKKLNGPQTLFVDSARTRIEPSRRFQMLRTHCGNQGVLLDSDQLTIEFEFYIALR